MTAGAITVGCADSTVVVVVRGAGNLFNSYPLQAFLSTMLEASADDFVVNLAECTQLDSTFLGVMAGLSQRLRKANKGTVRVLNASAAALDSMRRLGLNHLVELDTACVPALESPTELRSTELTKLDRGRHMLHAHLELSAISDTNEQQFAQLISTLKANVAKHEHDAP